jgi:hypothetical protein
MGVSILSMFTKTVLLNLKKSLFNSLTTYFDVKTTIELFAYLGYNNYYDESQMSAFNGKAN